MRMQAKRKPKLSGVQFPAVLDAMHEKANAALPIPSAEVESSLRERALLVRFSIGRWYGSGADEAVVNELRVAKNATGEIGSFTKRLMKRAHLADINTVTNNSRRYHKLMTLPWGDSGARLLTVEAYREYKQKMSQYEAEFFAAVDRFIGKYPELVSAEKKNLGDLWNASDYPSPEDMRASFRFGLAVDLLPDVQDVRLRLSKEHAEEVRKEVEQRLHAELKSAMTDLYERLAAEVSAIKEKLDKPDARLQDRAFTGLAEILAVLPKLNVTHDPQLAKLAQELQHDIVRTPVDTLRRSPTTRKTVSGKAQKMLDAIAALKQQGA